MRFKAVAVVLVLLIGTPKTRCGDIDDELLWERLVQGVRNDSSWDLPNLDESENLDLLETDLNSLSEDTSVQLNENVDLKIENSTDSDNIDPDLKASFELESTDALSDRVSRQPNIDDGLLEPDNAKSADTGIKGATVKPKPGQSSLVIIFDGTGSMLDDLKQLQKGARDIIEEITKRENNPIYNYIFIPFRDPGE